jgi:hypothetical protein
VITAKFFFQRLLDSCIHSLLSFSYIKLLRVDSYWHKFCWPILKWIQCKCFFIAIVNSIVISKQQKPAQTFSCLRLLVQTCWNKALEFQDNFIYKRMMYNWKLGWNHKQKKHKRKSSDFADKKQVIERLKLESDTTQL